MVTKQSIWVQYMVDFESASTKFGTANNGDYKNLKKPLMQ